MQEMCTCLRAWACGCAQAWDMRGCAQLLGVWACVSEDVRGRESHRHAQSEGRRNSVRWKSRARRRRSAGKGELETAVQSLVVVNASNIVDIRERYLPTIVSPPRVFSGYSCIVEPCVVDEREKRQRALNRDCVQP